MAFDVFLKIDGIDGEATAKNFFKWLNVESFSWGVTNAVQVNAAGGGSVGKALEQELHVVAPVQISSPKLFLFAAEGRHIARAELDVVGRDQPAFLKITFEDVLVSSFTMSGRGGDALPHDSFTLNYRRVNESVAPRLPSGALGGAIHEQFDFFKNVG